MSLDPSVYSQVQTSLISNLNSILATSIGYSQDLLYLTASIEIVLFALLWTIQGNNAFGRLIFTILKIGFLLMIINEFNTWLAILLSSFNQISASVSSSAAAFQLLEAPGQIWQFGYDNAVLLLKTASNDGLSIGLSLLLTTLGLGILLIFGLLGARLIVQVAAFYLTALIALLFLPFGVLKPTSDFAYRGMQSVLKSGVGLLTLILILTVATTIWQDSRLPADFNLNQILGVFFSGLIFLLLAQLLPNIAANAIGHIKPLLSDTNTVVTVNATPGSREAMPTNEAIRAATTIDTNNGAFKGASIAPAVHINQQTTTGSLAAAPTQQTDKNGRQRFGHATEISISSQTLQKLTNTRLASED